MQKGNSNRRTHKKRGGKGILRRAKSSNSGSGSGSSNKSGKTRMRKSVRWHPEVKSPKKPLGRTRSRTRAQQQQ
jgi:hypothetical protein